VRGARARAVARALAGADAGARRREGHSAARTISVILFAISGFSAFTVARTEFENAM
jgi:hypothetical protein